ncbi:Pyridoxamine phosphate oxidase [Mycena sanguinolenta]|uniref:Pyridoxamine phosphate oxidase n=1 Tax=Mycena sanguinolenta TaxID=230812 RepID=A0A8H6ZM35_9AGAR|nr:Pyridoxamine phosphate oxidase [Mycena sanguinolenta]
MVQYFDEISLSLGKWIEQQQVFWVATAPLTGDGHVNVSPKGGEGMFHIVNSRTVWYEDLTGSGVETVSHLRENGRITILFNAFEGPPRIVRLYGRGTAYEFGTPEYNNYISPESRKPGTRAVIVVDVHKVGTSCGYAVPFFDFKSHRTRLLAWAVKKEEADAGNASESGLVDGLKRYWNTKNIKSLDGLTGLDVAPYTSETFAVKNITYKADNESTRNRNRNRFSSLSGLCGVNLLVGFSVGVLVASIFSRSHGGV